MAEVKVQTGLIQPGEKVTNQSHSQGVLSRRGKPTPRAKILDAEKREEGRRAIGEVAFQLFVEYGYEATSVRAIADATGMSVGSIFNYFDTKEDILQLVLAMSQEVVEKTLANSERELEVLQERLAPTEVFREMYRRFILAIHETRHHTALGYQELKSLASEQRVLLYDRAEQIASLMRRAVEPGIRAGVFREDGIDLKIHWLIMLGHAWVLRHWWFRKYPIEQYAEALTKIGLAVLSCDVGMAQLAENAAMSALPISPATGDAATENLQGHEGGHHRIGGSAVTSEDPRRGRRRLKAGRPDTSRE